MAVQTFDLYVTFVGLCMLVDDRTNPKGRRVHVLLPKTDNHVEHFPVLLFRKGHLSGTAESPPPPYPAEECTLKDRQLNLTGLSTPDRLKVNVKKSGVFDLGEFVEEEVERHLLDTGDGSTAPNKCGTRVTLDAGSIVLRKKGSLWKIITKKPREKEVKTHMAITVQWRIEDVEGDHIDLQLEPLNKHGTTETVTLHPIDNEIRLFIYHSPRAEIPSLVPKASGTPIPPGGDGRAKHFAPFYDLLPAEEVAVPVFEHIGVDPTMETPPEVGEDPGTRKAGRSGRRALQIQPFEAAVGDEVACIMVRAEAQAP